MSIEVVIPYAGSCPHRAQALEWVRGRWPWPVTIAPGPEPWCKADAVMPAVERSRADVVVVADADVWCDEIERAVRIVQAGTSWAIPHWTVHRLTEQATREVLAGAEWTDQPLEERAYRGVPGGGIVVARRDVLLDVPLDARFVGWGQEDETWALALTALHGPAWRGHAPLIHFWHPPQQRMNRRRGNQDGWQLRRRYVAARHDPAAMRALIQEGRDAARAAPQPSLHAPAA